MSLFRRGREERRFIDALPWDAGGANPATQSMERALSLVPVFSAIGLLARTVSCTPLHNYRKAKEDERIRITLPAVFATMVTEASLKRWLHALVVSLAARGNAFGLVTSRDGYGYPTAVTWLDPTLCAVEDQMPSGPGSLSTPIFYYMGRAVHVGPSIPSTSDLIHIPWFPVPGRILGLSPLGAAAVMIQGGLASQEWNSEWFQNSGIPSATMKNTARTLLPEEADAVKQRLVSTIRAHKPLVYGSDWDFNAITIPPGEMKFVESMKLTATQVAAIYDVPPERVGGEMGGNLSYSSPEQAGQHLVTFTLRNWYELLEEVFSAMVPALQTLRFDADSLTRADAEKRYKVHQIARAIGMNNIDELRAKENEPPLPDRELGQDYTPLAIASDDLPDPKQPTGASNLASRPGQPKKTPPADPA